MMNRRRWCVVFAILAFTSNGCRKSPVPYDETRHIPRVQTVKPTVKALQVQSVLTASVEAMEKTELMSRVPGVVPTLPSDVDIGKPVRAGETIFTLEVPDLLKEREYRVALQDQANHAYEQSLAAEKLARKELTEAESAVERFEAEHAYRAQRDERTRKLVSSGSLQPEVAEETFAQRRAAKSAWDASKAQVETRQAKIASTLADIKVADSRRKVAAADVARLDTSIALAAVKAPFNGIITRRQVNSGDTIKDGSVPLLTVMRTDRLRVVLDIPERDVPLLRAEQGDTAGPEGIAPNRVLLTIPALPGEQISGTITRMASALDPATRTMRAEMHLERREGLKPGMYGRATVFLAVHNDRLTVPSTALVRNGDRVELVYVEVTDPAHKPPLGMLRRVEVDIGLDDGREVEIRGGAVNKDMLVIVKGNGVMREGDVVMPVLARTNPAERK
jgi:RND family efflux transporter MFP subunit